MKEEGRKKLAVITTFWSWRSHANHMSERFLNGYPLNGRWHRPNMDLVSAYVDQRPKTDLSDEKATRYGFVVYPDITQALRCGTDSLAVDAVLLIGEQGNYPDNEKGQKLYPRYEFFEQIVKVFREDGRSVPVFNDKHLSWSYAKAQKMVETSKELKFPFLAGSSLPVTFRIPPIEFPLDCDIDDALMVGVGGSDAMDFHALEAMQCMVERRRGGETGVKAVRMIEGDEVWRAGADGRWSRHLLEGALARSDSRTGVGLSDGRPQDLTHNGELEKLVENPSAYFIEYNDGFRATLLMLNGAVRDFTFAARLRNNPKVQSLQFQLPTKPNVTYSACLMNKVEEMIQTGRPPYPVERTLLVSGILDRCLDSRIQGHRRLLTPELNVTYRAPHKSQFWGAVDRQS
ncbi:MAG: hypothetical protein MK110_09170 [Fuerstiella sp.]|nr:hypothetical protein [Fuerstiella sp.]